MNKRFWFEFLELQKEPLPLGMKHGGGISAYDYNDAIFLLKENVFKTEELPYLKNVIENIDVSILDSNHVRLNMGDVTIRGVWSPLGY